MKQSNTVPWDKTQLLIFLTEMKMELTPGEWMGEQREMETIMCVCVCVLWGLKALRGRRNYMWSQMWILEDYDYLNISTLVNPHDTLHELFPFLQLFSCSLKTRTAEWTALSRKIWLSF